MTFSNESSRNEGIRQLSFYQQMGNTLTNKWKESHPSSYAVYQNFTHGIKMVFRDCSTYVKLRTRFSLGERISQFHSNEIHAFYTTPRKMLRITPAILVALVPGSLPLVIVLFQFPRYLLSHHFWSLAQRHEFIVTELESQARHYPPVLDALQITLPRIATSQNRSQLTSFLNHMSRETEIPLMDLVDGAKIFLDPALELDALTSEHRAALCGAHYLPQWPSFLSCSRLYRRAQMLMQEDGALLREHQGSPDAIVASLRPPSSGTNVSSDTQLSKQILVQIALHRGMYAYGLRDHELAAYLHRWFSIVASGSATGNASFYLHLPVLLTYPYSSMRQFIRRPWTFHTSNMSN